MRELRSSGMSFDKIAKELRADVRPVRAKIREWEKPAPVESANRPREPRPGKMLNDIHAIERMVRDGHTYAEAAAELGIKPASVARICEVYEIQPRRRVQPTFRRPCDCCGAWFTTPDRARRVCYVRHDHSALTSRNTNSAAPRSKAASA